MQIINKPTEITIRKIDNHFEPGKEVWFPFLWHGKIHKKRYYLQKLSHLFSLDFALSVLLSSEDVDRMLFDDEFIGQRVSFVVIRKKINSLFWSRS